ncbi:MAG: hypothetical protein JNJ78_10315, partial [Anaerolineae bacterium]|nr:hypothetical protein [Anaerolineae bacterium]
ISNGDQVSVQFENGQSVRVQAHVNGGAPKGTLVLPRHLSDVAVPLTVTVGDVSKA